MVPGTILDVTKDLGAQVMDFYRENKETIGAIGLFTFAAECIAVVTYYPIQFYIKEYRERIASMTTEEKLIDSLKELRFVKYKIKGPTK